jgi:hypothetical protein
MHVPDENKTKKYNEIDIYECCIGYFLKCFLF